MSIMIDRISADLLKLPVVLTTGAWHEAVHLQQPRHESEISKRLGDVVLLAYRELQFQPDVQQINFGLYRFPPEGDRSNYVWLPLTLHQIESELGKAYLCISLRDEATTPVD